MLDRRQRSTPVQVIGIGLEGATGLAPTILQLIQQATLLIGAERHLSYFPDFQAETLVLTDFKAAIEKIRTLISARPALDAAPQIVVLTSGDPLFFGFGRLLLAELPADWLTFHPHVSAIQLAFSRIKQPWQDARLISAHGRSIDQLTQSLQQGAEKIAVLTDGRNSPETIARLILDLQLPYTYQIWVCENLGGETEQVGCFTAATLLTHLQTQSFAHLNVVVLLRLDSTQLQSELPVIGIADQQFLSFSDRPGLMTKREIRTLILAELALQPSQVIWDIGAGTGSVAIELARLCPTSQIYAIEQTAAGIGLIQKNCQRFQTPNVTPIHSNAPVGLTALPTPDRIFIGGSGGNLTSILDTCSQRLQPQGLIVLALATLEHLACTIQWLETQPLQHQLLQIQLARSTPIAHLTRFTPLNPVTLVTLRQSTAPADRD